MNTEIEFLGKKFKNPIVPASGTFGFGYEFADLYDINILGSISIKGTTLAPRYGNPLPRIAECPAGLINSIGLQNPGVDKVVSEELVKLGKVYKDQVIANVGGHSQYEYVETVKKFNKCDKVFAVELNISCPNVDGGGMAFGVDPHTAYELVSAVRKVCKKPLIVKLSPNV
ncbi:MAG: dihydroorotate dehydrogenase catalytic subunit, partial [Acholeplasmatales bacterium]|nr:dihydroorotate dehydrogenase catalytic subunit [Acholeplasmatales bacterium]